MKISEFVDTRWSLCSEEYEYGYINEYGLFQSNTISKNEKVYCLEKIVNEQRKMINNLEKENRKLIENLNKSIKETNDRLNELMNIHNIKKFKGILGYEREICSHEIEHAQTKEIEDITLEELAKLVIDKEPIIRKRDIDVSTGKIEE